ncbi:MAG: ABC transporter ATP-binding protein [SAR202 cluster bacterium]|nr:ABC transporter ATP-binding protein [SAR202 cluster bacterium]
MNALVDIQNVGMVFQARTGLLKTTPVRALDGVNLSLGKGETLAVVGESGSGKTTLGRVCLGLLRPTSGSVVFDGMDVSSMADGSLRALRRRIQGIFQDPFSSLDPYMNVSQIIQEPLVVHKIGDADQRRQKMLDALSQVGLTPPHEFSEKFPHMMSGGQRQRVSVARALVLDPDFIVADEPVSMVDASSRAGLLSLLRGLQESCGLTFLYITHDIATAHHFSHRIAVLYLGRVVELGPKENVIHHPLHPYTQALIAAVPTPNPANRLKPRPIIAGEPHNPSRIPAGCRFHPRCPKFIGGTCDVTDPPLRELRPGHWAACHLY